MSFNCQLHRYADAIASLPEHFASDNPLPSRLKLSADHRHEVYYAPFDHVTPTARIVLVGITPGRVQAIEAIAVARRLLRSGATHTTAMAEAKSAASFAGPMRRNLVDLLDDVGVAERLRIRTTSDLWTNQSHLVHFTSALRYPVFEGGKNYSGSGLLQSPFLREQVDAWFASECRSLSKALIVPLGKAPQAACEYLVKRGALRESQILRGLPHPSGANAERIAYFLGRKPKAKLSAKTRAESLDAGRMQALRCVAGWT